MCFHEKETSSFWVIVKSENVSFVKAELEAKNAFDKTSKIIHGKQKIAEAFDVERTDQLPERVCAVPTTYSPEILGPIVSAIDLGLSEQHVILLAHSTKPSRGGRQTATRSNPFADTISAWLESIPELPPDLPSPLQRRDALLAALIAATPTSYQLYPPFLLLPASFITHGPWPTLAASLPRPVLADLYARLARAFAATHVARQAPIPLSLSSTSSSSSAPHPAPNQERRPLRLEPLHGDFGRADAAPDAAGFAATAWAAAKQAGVWQVWPPRHVMFSRGNFGEKVRVAGFGFELEMGKGEGGKEWAAVDMYAGIGYFAFSYAKARAALVLAWEINGWSVEGFRRGGLKNKWDVLIVGEGEETPSLEGEKAKPQLVMFHESNERALGRIRTLAASIPPVKHVNCGYLPTSESSWPDAVAMLDPKAPGWVHAHENVATSDIPRRQLELENIFNKLANRSENTVTQKKVECVHVERVKTYAPGVYHCVFDMQISPLAET